MPGQPYEAPQIADLGSFDDVAREDSGVYFADDDGSVVAMETSGPT